MGAFYQTSSPQFIDFGYKPPVEMMMKGIEFADKQITTQEEQLTMLEDEMAKIKVMADDKPRTKEILDAYQARVDQLATELNANPQNWRTRMPQLKGLARQISKDYSSGELAAYMTNYADFTAKIKDEKARLDKGQISSDYFEAAKNYYQKAFTGTKYNPETGDYNQIKFPTIAEYVDLPAKFDSYVKEAKANATEKKIVQGKQMYKITTEEGDRWMDETQLLNIAAHKYMADPKTQNYINQGVQFGIFSSAQDALEHAAKGAAQTYSFLETKRANDFTNDPVQTMVYQEGKTDTRQLLGFRHAEKMKGVEIAAAKETAQAAAQWQTRNEIIKWNFANPGQEKPVPADPYAGVPVNPFTGETGSTYEWVPGVGDAAGSWQAAPAGVRTQPTSIELLTGKPVGLPPGTPGGPGGGNAAGKGNTVQKEAVQVFTEGELDPNYLRGKALPLLNKQLEAAKVQLAKAQQSGNAAEIEDAALNLQSIQGSINVANGVIGSAQERYYQSPEFKGLSDAWQQTVKQYYRFLKDNNLADDNESRAAFTQQNQMGSYVSGPMEYLTRLSNPLFVNENISDFRKVINSATSAMKDNAAKDAVSNQLNIPAVKLDLSDPTLNNLVTNVLNGRTTNYKADMYGGKTITGVDRGVADLSLDAGNVVPGWSMFWGDGSAFKMSDLVAKTGLPISQLVESVSVLPSSTGKLKLKIKLKKEVGKDKDNIGNGITDYYQIEGLSDQNTFSVEVEGTEANRALINRLRMDGNNGVVAMSNGALNPDNAIVMDKFITLPKPPTEGQWTQPQTFSYGAVTYFVTKAADGRSNIKTHFDYNGKDVRAAFGAKDEEEALLWITNMHQITQSGDPKVIENLIQELSKNGYLEQ